MISSEEPVCPLCGSTLKLRDHKKRVWKKEGGKKDWIMIERRRCTKKSCRRLHNIMPDVLVPHKHYDSGIIEDVIDGVITEDDLVTEIYPCAATMERWRRWFEDQAAAIEGQIRSAAVRFLDLTGEFLKSKESLLLELREKISPGWLSVSDRIIYNSGGCIPP